jgi:hypothetical protein
LLEFGVYLGAAHNKEGDVMRARDLLPVKDEKRFQVLLGALLHVKTDSVGRGVFRRQLSLADFEVTFGATNPKRHGILIHIGTPSLSA